MRGKCDICGKPATLRARATCGLFDSKTGLMALLNFLLDSVSREMGKEVVDRLASIEKAWSGRRVFD